MKLIFKHKEKENVKMIKKNPAYTAHKGDKVLIKDVVYDVVSVLHMENGNIEAVIEDELTEKEIFNLNIKDNGWI